MFKLRIACQYLLGFRELMVGEIITSAAGDRQIDQAPKGIRRRFNSCRRMECEQIENDARIRFFGPGEEALIIFFDQSHSTVDDYRAVRAQQFCRLCQKVWKIPAWDVNLSDDEARFFSGN